jgi:outer membrane protein assembly factor BamB
MRRAWLGIVTLAWGLPCASVAADWPQWRGPHRNGVSAETGWLAHWPDDAPPPVAWRADVGRGHSAVSVSQGRALTMGWDGERDSVFCFDAATGELLWRQSYPCRTILQWPGPRATPTVDGETVFTLGQWGQLHAWDAATGATRWSVTLPESYNPDVDYGFAWSPLVEGAYLILAAGERGLAIDTRDGSFAWGHDGRHGACASAVPYRFGDQRGVALITTDPGRESVRLVGVDPRDGTQLWRSEPWGEKWGAACVDLLVEDGKVFVTTAEQHLRCARFSIDGAALREDWSNRHLTGYTGGCVLLGGHVYAVNKLGVLTCLDWETGADRWRQRGFGQFGTLIAAAGKLIVQASDSGELVVVEATPEGYRELRRTKVFLTDEHTFTAPVLANGRIYCRSYAGEVVCLSLSGPAEKTGQASGGREPAGNARTAPRLYSGATDR